jgi:GT2 family glycosyltransferase
VRSELLSAERVSVVVVSWNRPQHVRACLEHLDDLAGGSIEVIVVDASSDGSTAKVVKQFPSALCVPFSGGAGRMTTSRNVGLLHVSGDIIAFIDDDAYVRPGWLSALVRAFADPGVGAVAGRTCNGIAGEELEGLGGIGLVLANGDLVGNFAADPGEVTDVDHGIGANMSFRRELLARLGGFRDDFAGIGAIREDTDMFLRSRALGYRAVFAPEVVADHVGAPHVRGQRFDFRYMFSARRNHVLLLSRNFGFGSASLWRWVSHEMVRVSGPPNANPIRRAARAVMGGAAITSGLAVSVRKSRWGPVRPERQDPVGEAIRSRLSSPLFGSSGPDSGESL